MKVTPTKLRQNVYAILDKVLETGVPVEVVRKGKILKIIPELKKSKFDNPPKLPRAWVGDPMDIFKIDWMKEWREPEILAQGERSRKSRKP
jgi:hypothetical protein